MGQKQRIRTNIGKDQKLTVELKQDFGLLEVLSLKLSQQDIYTSLCSDYGVVCGRISVNNGYGVPNAKVSIFIPQLEIHENDPIISELYPYKSVSERNEDGYRYNLLPSRQQHGGHEPTGTFPDQTDIIAREEVLEVFENYYKYTVKTNDSGDFMIWGVPLGEQLLHVDLDISDMGCFSLRPDDLLGTGVGPKEFKSPYEYKASEDIDSLPQIVTFDRGIEVYPFWGNDDLCEIGITRADFDLSEKGIKIEPSAIVIGGTFSDDGKNSINKSCKPRKNMGKKCDMTTQAGIVEAIRFTPDTIHNDLDNRYYPQLEKFTVDDEINEDGSFLIRLPMNMNFLYTNEFGESDYTNDPNKGIPTTSCYRLRVTLKDEGLERVRARGSYLLPNIREYEGDEASSYAWSIDWNDYPDDATDWDNNIIFNSVDGEFYPQDYFYRFQYGKVYTVSSFQSLLFDSPKRTLAINDIAPSEDKDCNSTVNTFPINMGIRNTSFNFQLLLALVLAFIQFTFSMVSLTVYEFLAKIFNDIGGLLFSVNKSWGEKFYDSAIKIQEAGQMQLPLTIYDTCDECTTDDEEYVKGYDENDYCKIGEFNIEISGNSVNNLTYFTLTANEDTTDGSSLYDSGAARDCVNDDECCDSWQVTVDGYNDMNSETWDVSSISYPRFKMFIGGLASSYVVRAEFLIWDPESDYDTYPVTGYTIDGTPSTGFTFTNDQMSAIFDIDGADALFETTPKTTSGYILDRAVEKTSTAYGGIDTEEGCDIYDTLYNEETIRDYLWVDPENTDYNFETPTTTGAVNDINVKEQVKTNILPEVPPESGWSIGASVFHCDNERLPKYKDDWRKLDPTSYNRKTKTGRSEFRDGVFTIVPSRNGLCQKNRDGLREWYRRKIIGLNFCGGIVNYAFVDNWLSGSLYFFQFKAKIKEKTDYTKIKSCDTVVIYMDKPEHERFYYRSCRLRGTTWGIDNEKDNDYYIGHPTTFVDLGPRDEFIKEICNDPDLDPNCSVSRSIGITSYKSFGELVAFAVNYKMDVRNADMIINDFFKNKGFYNENSNRFFGQIFNGDVSQLISINSEAGIDGFDLQNQKYAGYSMSVLDPEEHLDIFSNGTNPDGTPIWGPTPVTLKYEDDGVRIRQCLNAPGYLTEASQVVPFYYWDKGGTGFGPYGLSGDPAIKDLDDQCWDYTRVVTQKLQGMTYGYKFTDFPPSGETDVDDPYLLPPISYDLEDGLTLTSAAGGSTSEEFDIVIPITQTPALPADDYDDVLKDYDTQNHMFTVLLATEYQDAPNDNIMNPKKGRLYVRLGDAGNWSLFTSFTDNPDIDITDDLNNWDYTYPTIWPTSDPYSTQKQILSTPFMFYFGLRPGKTGLDMLISRFGPKDAFTTVE